MRSVDRIKCLIQITFGDIICHSEIHIQIISAVAWTGTRYLTFKIADKLKHFRHEFYNIFRFIITGKKQIKTGTASHWPKVYGFVLKFCVIA